MVPDDDNNTSINASMPSVDPDELVGRTFNIEYDDGSTHKACIVEAIEEQVDGVKQHSTHVKFRVSMNNDRYEEIMAYNDVMLYL